MLRGEDSETDEERGLLHSGKRFWYCGKRIVIEREKDRSETGGSDYCAVPLLKEKSYSSREEEEDC